MNITKHTCINRKNGKLYPYHLPKVTRHAIYICSNCRQIFSNKPAYTSNYSHFPLDLLKDALRKQYGTEVWEKEWFKLKMLKSYLWKYMGKIDGDIFSYDDIFKA